MITVKRVQINIPSDRDLLTLPELKRFIDIILNNQNKDDSFSSLLLDLSQLIQYKLGMITQLIDDPNLHDYINDILSALWSSCFEHDNGARFRELISDIYAKLEPILPVISEHNI